MRLLTARRLGLALGALGVLLLAAGLLALGTGPSALSPGEIWAVLAGEQSSSPAADIVLRVRLPRVLLARGVGASLAVGRGWCSWGCFYGGWDELFSRLRKKPLIKHRQIDSRWRYLPFAVLLAIVLLSAITFSPSMNGARSSHTTTVAPGTIARCAGV